MAKQLFADNASALLAASINDTDLTIQVAGGFGALFPNPGADEFFLVTLENESGDIEIVKISARATDLLTVPTGGRGQEGTSAQSWTNGVTRVELRLTKGTMDRFIQREGDVMEGDLDMDNNEIQDAQLTGTGTKILAGEIVNVPLRGVSGDSSNEVAVPTDGTRATASGDRILTEADNLFESNLVFPAGMIMLWYGLLANIPTGWHVCDGTGGTPDMRGRVPLGVSGSHAFDSTGGSETATGNTGAAGGHTPTGTAASHVLTADEIPAHQHYIAANTVNTSSNDLDNAHAVDRANSLGGSNEYKMKNSNTAANVGLSSSVGGGGGHSHDLSISAVPDHTHDMGSVSTLPPYRALYYIMKT